MKYFFIIILSIFTSSCSIKKIPSKYNTNNFKNIIIQVDKSLKQTVSKNKSSISIAIIIDNKIVYKRGYGYSNIEKKILATAKTKYRVASVSKVINSIGIMRLVDSGKLKLNTPISKYIKNFELKNYNNKKLKVTLSQLLRHTSAISETPDEVIFNPKYKNCNNLIKFALNSRVTINPNIITRYSNYGVELTRCIIEEVTKKDYSLYMKNLFIKLEMNNSYFISTIKNDDVAINYINGKQAKRYNYYFLSSMGLVSTVEDLSKIIIMLNNKGKFNNKKILSTKSIKKILKAYRTRISKDDIMGLGWFVDKTILPNNEEYFYHSGGVVGYSSYIALAKKSKIGIVILSNDESMDTNSIAENIMKKLWNYKNYNYKLLQYKHIVKKVNINTDIDGRYSFFNGNDYFLVDIKKIKDSIYLAKCKYGDIYLKIDLNGFLRIIDVKNFNQFIPMNTLKSFKIFSKKCCGYNVIFMKNNKYNTIGIKVNTQNNTKEIDNLLGNYYPTFKQYGVKEWQLNKIEISYKNSQYFMKRYYFGDEIENIPIYFLDNNTAKMLIPFGRESSIIKFKHINNKIYLEYIGLKYLKR